MSHPGRRKPSCAVLGKTRRVHFIGIGGIGMSGIAELLANLGFVVTGSDARQSKVTDRLSTLGIDVAYGHAPEHVGSADVVVVSSAVRAGNPEVVEADRRQIPVVTRRRVFDLGAAGDVGHRADRGG